MSLPQPGNQTSREGGYALQSILSLILAGVIAGAGLSAVVVNIDYRANQVAPGDVDAFAYLGYGFYGGFLGAFACPIGAALGATIGTPLGHKKLGATLGAAAGILLAVALPRSFT